MEHQLIQLLLAEDNRDHQSLLLRALTRGRPFVQVTIVDSGAEFLRTLSCERFDCAILDFNLSDYRADELLELARPNLKACPTLVISSSQEQEVVIRAIRGGGADFVPKMSATYGDELWSRVEHAIGLARRKRNERRRTERRVRLLATLAERDGLTDLSNRRHFDRCLREGRWREDRRAHVACIMLDVDRFKAINDTFGHAAGDDVLRQMARIIRRHCIDSDTTVRWGGEEFLIVRSATSVMEAWLWAERLRMAVEGGLFEADGRRLHVTVSLGVTQGRAADFGLPSVKRADRAMYLAKRQGRNLVCTTEMADIMDRVKAIGARPGLDLEARRRALLKELNPTLGRTQRTHVNAHCQEVALAAQRIAVAMRCPTDVVEQVRLAGLLHDIGKVMIPEELLGKPRTLTIPERAVMGRHDRYGLWIAKGLGAPEPVLAHCRDHHTRFDHSDEQVSLGARIVCLADAMVTMTSHRSYKETMAAPQAIAEILRQRNRQFAPAVVDAVCAMEHEPRQAA